MYFTFLYLIKWFFLQQLSQSHHTCFLNYEKIKINALNKKKMKKTKLLSQIFQLLPEISMDTHFKSIKKRGIDYYVRNKIKKKLSNSKTELWTQEMDNWQYTL